MSADAIHEGQPPTKAEDLTKTATEDCPNLAKENFKDAVCGALHPEKEKYIAAVESHLRDSITHKREPAPATSFRVTASNQLGVAMIVAEAFGGEFAASKFAATKCHDAGHQKERFADRNQFLIAKQNFF